MPTTPAVAIVDLASIGATTLIGLLLVIVASFKPKPQSLPWKF